MRRAIDEPPGFRGIDRKRADSIETVRPMDVRLSPAQLVAGGVLSTAASSILLVLPTRLGSVSIAEMLPVI
jgi:hypothetical protein